MHNGYKNRYYSLLLLFPGTLIYVMLFILPVLIGLYYSFTNWDFFTARFTGFDNYISILTDSDMNISIKNTIIFAVVTTLLKVVLGMLLAVFLNRELKTKNFLRTVFYLPAVINTVAIGILFSAVLHPTDGILNKFLNALGLGILAQEWLTNIHIAIYSIAAIEVWKWTGFTMIIILAGLQTVSGEYYEAADIDGASAWKKFRHITFPLIIPAFNNALVGSIIGGLKVFDIVMVTTNGGPGSATSVLNTLIFKSYGGNYQGEASAGSMILAILVALVAISTYIFIRKREVEL